MQKNRKLLASLCISVLSAGFVSAGGTNGGDSASYSPHNSVSMGYLLSSIPSGNSDTINKLGNYQKKFDYVNQGTKQGKGLSGGNLEVSGVTRFITIQRTMQKSYEDMTTSNKNISFTDYIGLDANSGLNAGLPQLELNLKSQLKKDFNFNVGYSLGHNMTGDIDGTSRNLGAVQNLNFGAQMRTGMFKTSIWAGEVLWTNLSRLTMGQPEFTDNYFERLPWDWYRTSFTRYQEYFTLSSNIGARNLGSAPIQGTIGLIEWLPMQTSLKVIYGQSNRNLIAADQGTGFPSMLQCYRLEKYIFQRGIKGKSAINVYGKKSYTDIDAKSEDNNSMYTLDFDVKVKRVNFDGEVGFSQINTHNPDGINYKENGFGAVFRTSFDRRAVLWPFSVEFFNLDKNFGNVDGSLLNQNANVQQGGASNEFIYNDSYFPNVANEAGQLTNNRRGLNLELEANLGELKVQFGYSASQEIEKLSDSLTVQHRVNSFSRSRFRPFFSASGPYRRVKFYWWRTYETLTLSNDGGYLDRDLLGFNALELCAKYKKPIGNKQEIILLNLSTVNTIKEGFNIFSVPTSDDVLASVLYNDFTAAFKMNNKLSLIGNFAIESMRGSVRTNLSPDKLGSEDKDRIISQIGTMTALGIDYDLSRKTSLHLRTKYMTHKDKNFLNDEFSGLETTFELKIFL